MWAVQIAEVVRADLGGGRAAFASSGGGIRIDMGFFKKAAIATAMATAVVAMVGQGGALAATGDVAGFVGTGTITPGLPTTGCAVQSDITFTGTGAVLGVDGNVAPANVNFNGNSGSTCETLNSGQGSGTLTGTISSDANGVSYQRNGSIVIVSADAAGVTVNGHAGRQPVVAVCIFVPTSVNPVQSYALICASVL
jgi:hypothetical protein